MRMRILSYDSENIILAFAMCLIYDNDSVIRSYENDPCGTLMIEKVSQ